MYTIPVPACKINDDSRQMMGESIYLLIYLIQRCNWKNGRAKVTYAEITEDTGFPLGTIRRWMEKLRMVGEIDIRRIPDGMVVKINDYSAVARTRGVETSDCSEVSTPMSENEHSECSDMDSRVSKNGHSDCSEMNSRVLRNEQSNIKQNLSQNKVQNTFQNALSSFLSSISPEKPKRDDIFDYEPEDNRKLREARELIEALDEESRQALMKQAMESLEQDKHRFNRIFVHRNEQGELEPTRETGLEMVFLRMGEMLKMRNATPTNCTDDSG